MNRINLEDKTFKQLVPIADRDFSVYIRVKYANPNGLVRCATCGKAELWDDGMDCGHYIDRGNFSVRWDPHNAGPQCIYCNRYKDGRPHIMRLYLIDKYSRTAIEKVEAMDPLQIKWTAERLRKYILKIRYKTKILREEKGI